MKIWSVITSCSLMLACSCGKKPEFPVTRILIKERAWTEYQQKQDQGGHFPLFFELTSSQSFSNLLHASLRAEGLNDARPPRLRWQVNPWTNQLLLAESDQDRDRMVVCVSNALSRLLFEKLDYRGIVQLSAP